MSIKILVVDDDEELANLLVLLLNKRGYEARAAFNGREAIELAGGFSPNIILQDFMLPDINGLNLFEGLREASPLSSVIVITAKGNEDVAVEIMKAGAADYLKKPFETERLLTAIEDALKQQTSAAMIEKLNRELAQQNQELNSINALSNALVSTIPGEERYRIAVEIASKYLKADLASLFIYDSESRSLKLLASSSGEMELSSEYNVNERRAGFAFYVSEARKPVVVIDFETEKRFKVPDDIKRRGLKSAIGVPIIYKDSLKGVLSIYTSEGRNFASFEMKLMGNLANLIALSLEDSRMKRVLTDFQNQWQVTFDAVPERIVLQDLEHRVIMANEAAAKGAGLEVKDLIGQVCSWVFHNIKEPIEGCPVEEVMKTKKPARKEMKVPGSGEVLEVFAYPVMDGDGNLMMVAEYLKKIN